RAGQRLDGDRRLGEEKSGGDQELPYRARRGARLREGQSRRGEGDREEVSRLQRATLPDLREQGEAGRPEGLHRDRQGARALPHDLRPAKARAALSPDDRTSSSTD